MRGNHARREETRKCVFREMRRPFLWSVTWSDVRFWWRRQLITAGSHLITAGSTVKATLDGVCVCTHAGYTVLILIKTQLSLPEQQCFLSAACYLFNKHLHKMNEIKPAFSIYTVYCTCSDTHELFLSAECVYLFIICVYIYWYYDCEFII